MIQVVNRAIDIIEFIASDTSKDHRLSDIATHLNLNQGTCANIIKTLVDRNYLEQTGYKQGYKLGYRLYQFGGESSFEEKLVKIGIEPMNNLCAKFNETCILAVLKKQNRVIIHQANAERDLMVKSSTEKIVYDSASGRFLLAAMEDEELNEFIEKFGLPSKEVWAEASTREGLKVQIDKIRKQGYARQETVSHIIGLAFGISSNKKVLASLSIYLPSSRMKEHGEKEILKYTKLIAQQIEEAL